jgi:hypothetical protein
VELPTLSISSYTGLGNNGSVPNDSRDFSVRGTITHVMGRHTIRAGAEGRLQNYSQQINGNVSGTYSFDDT